MRESHRGFIQNGFKDYGGGFPAEGRLPGGHLIQHGPEGKDVGTFIQVFAARLLGRHVSDGAHGRTVRGERGGNSFGGYAVGFFADQFGEPEIQHLANAACRQEDVSRFQVAVDNSPPVGSIQRVGDFESAAHQFTERKRTPGQAVSQSFALQMLQNEVIHAVLRANVVKLADVGVIERGNGTGFTLKAFARFQLVRAVDGGGS